MVRDPPAAGEDAVNGKLDWVVDENRHEENAEFGVASTEDGGGEGEPCG